MEAFDWSELSNWSEYSKLFAGMMAVVPPPIVIPLFLGLVGGRSPAEQRRIALYATIGFIVTMLLFIWFGEALLGMFGISIDAFRVAGGLLLLLMGIEMIRTDVTVGVSEEQDESVSAISLSLVPMTIPLLAGPGAISTVILFAENHEGLSHKLVVSITVLIVALLTYLLFRLALKAGSLFTPTVATAFSRIMGLVVTAIAVEFILHGIAGHFPDVMILH